MASGNGFVNHNVPVVDFQPVPRSTGWHRSLAEAIREPDRLIDLLGLPDALRAEAHAAARLFPLMVPRSYLARMRPGDPADPLLRQVLPSVREHDDVPGFVPDAVDDERARVAPGLLKKYAGRALLITTGACAVHCRYCFRRHYPYGEEPRRLDEWTPAIDAITADTTLHEILLSGGDPLMLTDARLHALVNRLAAIPHLRRLRVHSRLPIVLPDRITPELTGLLTSSRLTPIVVVHANHPHEVAGDCAEALRTLVRSGITTLNQAVLLRGVNDDAEVQIELSERLIDLGVVPYYLHQLDRVAGTAHFEVPVAGGRHLTAALRWALPGYGVPSYVREEAGEPFKVPLTGP